MKEKIKLKKGKVSTEPTSPTFIPGPGINLPCMFIKNKRLLLDQRTHPLDLSQISLDVFTRRSSVEEEVLQQHHHKHII